jgi:hypothetical protein
MYKYNGLACSHVVSGSLCNGIHMTRYRIRLRILIVPAIKRIMMPSTLCTLNTQITCLLFHVCDPCCHQDEAEIPEMMEEEEPLADADAGAAPVVVQPTILMPPSPSPLQPTQGQEAAVLHDSTVSTESGSRSSEPTLAVEQAAPMAMGIEEDSWQSQPQRQPGKHPHFWSG